MRFTGICGSKQLSYYNFTWNVYVRSLQNWMADLEQNGAVSSCLPPVTGTAHRDGPALSFLPLFEQLQLGSNHTSWVGCKSPKEVLLEWQCPHLWLKSHPALAGIELGTYKPNVAPFPCFSRYLQQFLLNKALILHSISFFSHVLGHSDPNQPSRAT